MPREVYISIRNKRTFLYEYFIKSGGFRISEPEFTMMFGIWASQFGLDPQTAVRKIVIFLDKKFDYNQKNS